MWFNGQPVAVVQADGVYYVHADHLATPRSIVRAANGAEVWRWDSEPFGATSPTNPNPASGGLLYNVRFPGQYLDVESGVVYNGMRDYLSATGRYLQADPIGLRGGLSRYWYAAGNPLISVDPTGQANFLFGGGGTYTKWLGAEGWLGVYVTFGGSTKFDIGLWGTGGLAYGYNIGGGPQFGFVKGDVADLRGITYNLNGGITPGGGSLLFDQNWSLTGFIAGPVDQFGLSITYAKSDAVGLHDLGSWLGEWLYDKLHGTGCGK